MRRQVRYIFVFKLPCGICISKISPFNQILHRPIFECLFVEHSGWLEPSWSDAVSIKPFIQFQRVFGLVVFQTSCHTLVILAFLVKPLWLVHIVSAEIHSVTLGMEDIQLDLLDPGTVPVRHILPFNEELSCCVFGNSLAAPLLFTLLNTEIIDFSHKIYKKIFSHGNMAHIYRMLKV